MKKILSLLLAVCLLIGCVPLAAYADEANTVSEFAYGEDSVDFIKATVNSETQLFDRFAMLAAQEGSTATINGDNVVIHIIPKNTTTYSGIHFGTPNDTDLTVNAELKDGAIDITLPKTQCGYAWPVVAINGTTGKASSQFYLAIPAEDKLDNTAETTYTITFKDEDGSVLATVNCKENEIPVFPGEAPTKAEDDDFTYTLAWSPKLAKATKDAEYKVTFTKTEKNVKEFAYDGDSVNFINIDKEGFGMFTPQEGTTAKLDGDNVVIHYIPKNTTVYGSLYFGKAADVNAGSEQVTKDVVFNEDGTFDITLSKDKCGYAWPAAPMKISDGKSTSGQYYLAIPAEDKLDNTAETTYTITFKDEDGSVLATVNCKENEMPVFPGEAPTKAEDDDFTYTLAWSPKLAKATKDAEYKVTFTKTEKNVKEFAYDGDSVNFINIDKEGFGMFTPQEGTTAKLDGDNVVIHYIPKNTTVYGSLYFGKAADVNAGSEQVTKDVVFNEDGTFDITLSKDKCGYAWPAAPMKISDGKSTSGQYYLAIPAEDKLSPAGGNTPSGGGTGGDATPETPADESIDLKVTNNVKMFKVIEAKLETTNGSTNLVVTLSATGYHYLYKGTFKEAKKVGYKTSKWIEGKLNKDSKYVFSIPVDENETSIPIVSISQTYVDNYLDGKNKIERAFFPRMLTLDAKKKTLIVDDFSETKTLKVSNKTDLDISKASLETVGGPNSNDYSSTLYLTMKSGTYTKAYIGTAKKAASAKDTVAAGSGDTFKLKVRWMATPGDLDSIESYISEDETFAFYNADDKAWEEFTFNINDSKYTLTVTADEEAEAVPAEEVPAEGEGAKSTFIDIKDSDWYDSYAEKAAELDLMTGYAAGKDAEGNDQYEFRGTNKVTRAMFVTILSAINKKLNGDAAEAPSAGFADVEAGAWYEKAVNWAYANGITAGRSTGFGVNDNVSRQDMAVFMYAYAKSIGKVTGTPDTSVLDKYEDASSIAPYAKEAMAWLVSSGLMTGRSETSIAPLAESTRAEISAFAVSSYDFLSK